MKREIKNVDKQVLFSYDCEDNTIKKTIEEAVKQKVNLKFADFHNLYLFNINFYNANLHSADFSYAYLNYTDFRYADLSDANFRGANLRDTNLHGANLHNADLENANLEYICAERANFYGVNFKNANLENVNIHGANLSNAKNIPSLPMNLPNGEFIGWKKLENDLIAKLKILKDSKRSQATTKKCRCDKALVLEFQNIDGTKSDVTEQTNYNYTICQYKVGEVVYADSWDDNRWNECSHGIHFFLDRETAVNYYLI